MFVQTSMRAAFENAKVQTRPSSHKEVTSAHILNVTAKGLERDAGIRNMGQGWNAHLSKKSYERLVYEGVMG